MGRTYWGDPWKKKLKYDELLELCWNNGWKASCLPVEVGARGFTARLLY